MRRDSGDLADERIALRLLPFAVVTVVALSLAVPWSASSRTYVEYGLSWLVMLFVGAAALLGGPTDAMWARLGRSLMYLVGVGLLREVTGGSQGGVGIIVLVPVVWVALFGTPRMLQGVIVGVAVAWVLPLVAIGAPHYPATGWRTCVLIVALAAIIGQTVQRLVDEIREQARHAQRHVRERERLLAQVNELARTDALTGVANRRAWEERLAAESRRPEDPICIVVLDVDRFKALNDRCGHEAGDRCLRESAAAWAAQLRPRDLLARLGGDEFAILLSHCPLQHAVAVAERVRAATVSTTCSIGVAEWNERESLPELQARADEMLCAAKRRSRAAASR